MRKKMQTMEGERQKFTGIFSRNGFCNGWKGSLIITYLFFDVKNTDGKIITDHIWFKETKGFDNLCPDEGDIIEFDARVVGYVKGYWGRKAFENGEASSEYDYKLSHPTKIKKVGKLSHEELQSMRIKHLTPGQIQRKNNQKMN